MACVACQLLVGVQFRQVVAVSGSCCVRECLSSCVRHPPVGTGLHKVPLSVSQMEQLPDRGSHAQEKL